MRSGAPLPAGSAGSGSGSGSGSGMSPLVASLEGSGPASSYGREDGAPVAVTTTTASTSQGVSWWAPSPVRGGWRKDRVEVTEPVRAECDLRGKSRRR